MKEYGYEGVAGSEKEESIDDILKSIRGLVYPDRGTFREPVIDLNRPVRDEPEIVSKDMQAPSNAQTMGQEKEDKQPMAAAVHAVSSFIHVVRGGADQGPASGGQPMVNEPSFADRSAKEPLEVSENPSLPTSVSLETFLRQAIEPALFAQLDKILDARLQDVACDKIEAFMEKWLAKNAHIFMEKWLSENAPSLVVRCVEVYLKQITKACSSS